MSEDKSIYDRLTKPGIWSNPAPVLAPIVKPTTATQPPRQSQTGDMVGTFTRDGETQFAGKYDAPDAQPDDERFEPGYPFFSSKEQYDQFLSRIPIPTRADDEAGVIAKHLAAERDECEHIALFTLRDSLTEEWTDETEEQVHTARLILLYLLETK